MTAVTDHGLAGHRGGCARPVRQGWGRIVAGERPTGKSARSFPLPVAGRDHSLRSVNMADLLFDAIEREQLCDLLDELGPQAPTLLDPWTTHDLAAHLVLREHDFLAAPGLVVPGAWGRFAERRRLALKETGFTDLVATIRSGPPPGFFKIGWVRRFPNLNEFFVHHEDVRRANGFGPRTNPPAEDAALFRNVAVRPGSFAPAAGRGARARVGRNGPGHQSAARATDRSRAWASGRAAPVPLRTAGRG